MKASKIIKTAVLSVFTVLVIAGGVFAVDYTSCVGDNNKYPGLSASENDDYPVKCTRVKVDDEYVTFYGKTKGDCAQASALASDPEGCNASDFNEIIRLVINAIVFVVGMVAVVMIILGGINYATSQGDPGKVKKGKDTILYGIIGLVISILAFAIVNFVLGALQN